MHGTMPHSKVPRRLFHEHLIRWRAYYQMTLANYKRGAIGDSEVESALMDLNYKNGALDIEMLEFARERSKWRQENGRNP